MSLRIKASRSPNETLMALIKVFKNMARVNRARILGKSINLKSYGRLTPIIMKPMAALSFAGKEMDNIQRSVNRKLFVHSVA